MRKKQIKARRKKKKIYAFFNPSRCYNALRLGQNERTKGKNERRQREFNLTIIQVSVEVKGDKKEKTKNEKRKKQVLQSF